MTTRALLGSWFAPLLIHGLNQHQALQRATVAKMQGLDPKEFGTVFPGSTVTTTNNIRPTIGWLLGPILGVLLAATGAAGLYLLTHQAGKVLPQPAAAGETEKWDAIYEEQQPDGSWKTIRRDHLK